MRDGTDDPDPDWAVPEGEAGGLTGAWPTDDWLTGPPRRDRAIRHSARPGTSRADPEQAGHGHAGPGQTGSDPDAAGARRGRAGRTRLGPAYLDVLDSDLRGYRRPRSAWNRAGDLDVIYPDPVDLPQAGLPSMDPDALDPFPAGGDAADPSGLDPSGVGPSGMDPSGVDLSGMDLDGADLSGADPDALERFLAGDDAMDMDDSGLIAPDRDVADPDTARIGRARSRWKGADAAEPAEWFGGEEAARAACLRLLTTAPRTRAQLATALRRRRVPEDIAESVLARFTEVGLIDDAAFARAWVESRHHSKGLARRALAAELRQRGIAAAEVRDAVGSLGPQDEMEAARQLVLKRLPASRGRPLPNRARQLLGMLARKGYPAGLAAQVVREALEQEEAGNPEARQDLALMSEDTASEGWL